MHTVADRESRCTSIDVQLRPFPYPYRAMLAICSDLDDTPDRHVYWEIMRFLNTTDETSMGPGVRLEVGNSIHFRAQPGIFSYYSTDDAGREMVRTMIQSGHVDCLHSFGECIYTRDEARQALDELERHDCHLEVWVDHGGTVTNFGPDIMQGHGDEVSHPAYHADMTINYGIKYVCRGRGTSIIGQDIAAKFGGIFTAKHPVASGRTLIKELAKQGLARMGNPKYAMHKRNATLRPIALRDERKVYEFMRCNPHWGGVDSCATGRSIGDVLTGEMLARLVERGGTCVLYTHLGRIDDRTVPFNPKAASAFRRLAEESHDGRILVTTTRRLLGYRRALQEVAFTTRREKGMLRIDLTTRTPINWVGVLPTEDLAGLTFYVPDSEAVLLAIDGTPCTDLKRNPADPTGCSSVSLPWSRLEFPRI
ncbi:MAG: hypothetical protein GXY19_16375 [Phycisphaerae bacterium]|nr:hypothetical protein [Phycisphaerae bacterium]